MTTRGEAPGSGPAPGDDPVCEVPGSLRVDAELKRDGFHLRLEITAHGGVLVLFGPSGAGKSTVLQAIAGLVTPDAGEIARDGRTLFRRGRPGPAVNIPARKRRVGYVFQSYALFPHLTALGNVSYPLHRATGAEARARALLERLSLGEVAHRYPPELSGGQQQRVAIARALIAEPAVLLLDEPFAALDLETRRQVRGEVRRVLHELSMPVILVTHDREEALAMGDRVAVLDRGRVVAEGDPVALLGHPPRERVARLLGVENLLRLEVLEVLPEEGIMRCARGVLRLDVPLSDAKPGEEVTVGVRADDVLLASARPEGLSARNVLRGRVASVEPHGAFQAVRVDCGRSSPVDHGAGPEFSLVSHVTRGRVAELGVRPGAEVWAVLKTASCFLLRD